MNIKTYKLKKTFIRSFVIFKGLFRENHNMAKSSFSINISNQHKTINFFFLVFFSFIKECEQKFLSIVVSLLHRLIFLNRWGIRKVLVFLCFIRFSRLFLRTRITSFWSPYGSHKLALLIRTAAPEVGAFLSKMVNFPVSRFLPITSEEIFILRFQLYQQALYQVRSILENLLQKCHRLVREDGGISARDFLLQSREILAT